MSAAVLTHPHFQSAPAPVKRRRGRLPRGVVSIRSVPRLRIGVLAELFDQVRSEDNGKRVHITRHDPANAGYHYEGESLDGPIQCEGGAFEKFVWFKPAELRRLWTGLSERERIQLRLLRGAS